MPNCKPMINVARVKNTLVVTGRSISKWNTSSIFFEQVGRILWRLVNGQDKMGTQCYILVISPCHLGDCTIILS